MSGDQYRSLAADYHWFFDDAELLLGCDTPGVRAVIAGLPPGARVLDAACGIGLDAAALLRRGLDVAAADASPEMVDLTRARLRAIGASDDVVVVSDWTGLPNAFEPGGFDAVFCVGNSLAHAAGEADMISALAAFRRLLAPGGRLVLDSQDWEQLHTVGSHVMIEPTVVERDGVRCVRTYSWHLTGDLAEPVVLEVAPIFLEGDRATLRSYPVTMWPFTRAELRQRLAAAGFAAIGIDAIPGDDRYTAVARCPG